MHTLSFNVIQYFARRNIVNINFFPKLPESTYVLNDNNKFLFIISDKPDWIVTNKNFASILMLCNGKNSIEKIYNIINKQKYGKDGIKILNTLIENNFFENKIGLAKHYSCNLSNIHLNMTSKCNLSCIYCYADERSDIKGNLELNNYYKIIDDAFLINNTINITFTGGEPLLNKNTIDVAKYCKSKNIKTFLLTNGTCINEDNAEIIAKNFTKIRISIDGCTEKTHELHRGKGTYFKVNKAISLLEKYGMSPMLAMTVTNMNIHEIEGLATKYGNRLTFQPLYSVGKGRNNLNLDGKTYFEALKNASGVEPYAQLEQKLNTTRNHGCTKCAIGDGEISISASGNVYPCHMLHVEKFCAGNIKDKSLTEIYYNSKVLKDIRSLSVIEREGCKNCPIRLICGGGCWARAFYAHGNLQAADDFCDYELSAFTHGLFMQADF